MDFENNILKINDKKTLKITKYECSNKYLLLLIFGTLLNFCTMITSLLIYSKNNQRFIKQYTISEDTFKIINDNYSTKFNENLFEILNLLKYKSYNNTNYFNISEKLNLLKYMTNNNDLKYKGPRNCLIDDPDRQLCIYHLLSPKKVDGKKRILLGEKGDGSYVILDDFDKIKIAYSFGIFNKVQFDEELANRGIDVYMYDHTINSLPYTNSHFHWKKIGVRGKNTKDNNLKTLEELIIENNHIKENNMILKMDVEGAEWESLKDLPGKFLNKFKYILIEYHFLNPEAEGQLYYNVLKKIHKYHQPFYFRCHMRNLIVNFGNNRICQYLEVSYVTRKNNKFLKDDSIYPLFEFDFTGPNLDEKAEMEVNILTLFDS
jgi:hypothetical protein